jgi:hypothetical protein
VGAGCSAQAGSPDLLLPHVELVLRRLDLQRARQECGKASGAGSAEAATELRKKKDGEKGRRAAAAWYASRGEHRSDGLDRPRRFGLIFHLCQQWIVKPIICLSKDYEEYTRVDFTFLYNLYQYFQIVNSLLVVGYRLGD